jgi:hypothetical protein
MLTLSVGTAGEDGQLVAHEPTAAVGEDGWPAGKARPLLLAAIGGESSGATALWEHGAADCGAPLVDRIGAAGKPTGRRTEG